MDAAITVRLKADGASVAAIREGFGKRADAVLRAVLREAGREIVARWKDHARAELHTSKDVYVRAIGKPEVDVQNLTVTVPLEGEFPNMVELGADPFDLRDTLLGGPGTKLSAAGDLYRAVQFQHASNRAKAFGRERGTPMGESYRELLGAAAAKTLGERVYQAARLLGPGELLPEGTGGAGLLQPHHTADIYARMTKTKGSGAKSKGGVGRGAGATAYFTYRTISENGDPASWQYPGLDARNLRFRVQAELPAILTRLLEAATGGLVKPSPGGSGGSGSFGGSGFEPPPMAPPPGMSPGFAVLGP